MTTTDRSDSGIPSICVCGRRMRLEVCTTRENRGRKYYRCPMSEDGGGDDSIHKRKWWDDAVEEELGLIKSQIEEKIQSVTNGFQFAFPALDQMRESTDRLHKRIDELTARLGRKEVEIDRLKELLREWSNDV